MPAEFTKLRFVIVSLFPDAFFCLLLSIFVFVILKEAYSRVNYPIQRVGLFSNGIFSYVPCFQKTIFTNIVIGLEPNEQDFCHSPNW